MDYFMRSSSFSVRLNQRLTRRVYAALLFWFFGDFRCGVLLFIFFLLYINIEIGKNRFQKLE